ncbi:MAG TPA: porin family protein [Chryseolinea sp.]|nr:porin family protein [Chryseolinea sp.]HPM29637.1 porin family protein [Chryseolinea sp.]
MRILLTSILLVITSLAHGQILISLLLGDKLNSGKIEFGLDGGINYPSIRGLNDGKLKTGFNLGFYFDIKLKNPQWMVHTGVLVKSSLGTSDLPVYLLNNADLDSAFVGGKVERKINYFNVPIMMKYRFKNNFSLEGGFMPSLRAKAYDIFTNEINGDDLEYKADIRDQILQLDFGLMAGAGYRLMRGNGMNFTVRYYYGLRNISAQESMPDQYNQSLYLSIGIPIGVAKAKKKEEEKK